MNHYDDVTSDMADRTVTCPVRGGC